MNASSTISLIAKGLISAGVEFTRTMVSARTLNGLWYSLYRYPVSPDFKRVSAPKDGMPLPNGACVVFNAGYGVALFGLEGLPPYDTHRFADIYKRLLAAKTISPETVFVPGPVSDDELLAVHGQEYIRSFSESEKLAEILEVPIIGLLPAFAVKKIVSAFRYAAGGTILAAQLALEHGFAVNLGGGFHHARPHRGGGFCLIADIPVAIKKIRAEKGPLKVLVIDLDVHQGDGTIECTAKEEDVFTFSMHQAEIFPFPKEVGDLDVAVAPGTGDEDYLSLLEAHLPAVFKKSRPDIVFYVAGADVLAADPLASVNLSADGLIARDRMVAAACRKRGVPMVMTLAGGYSPQAAAAQFQSIQSLINTNQPEPA